MLTLPEELFLLSINEEEGVIQSSVAQTLRYGIVAAMLVELTLQGNLGMEKGHLVVLEDSLTGDDLLDEALKQVIQSSRPRKPYHWVNLLSQDIHQLKSRLAAALESMGILHPEGKRLLWIIPYDVYPQQDASAKYWIKQRLRNTILTDLAADPRSVSLLSLLMAAKMLDLVFTKDERKAARHKIKQLLKDEAIGHAMAGTIEQFIWPSSPLYDRSLIVESRFLLFFHPIKLLYQSAVLTVSLFPGVIKASFTQPLRSVNR